ncbi:MAG: class I SAM-dependent rRNA methyltransferase [Trueperaceae bacterium]
MSLKTLNLGKNLENALRSGHPWIYRNHLPHHNARNGEWVRLEAGRASSIGLYDAESTIALRLFSEDTVPNRSFIHERVKQALELRKLISEDTDAYRLLYGESDFLPGVVADKYGRYVIIKTYSSSVETFLPDVVWSLSKELKLRGIARRTERGLESLWGDVPPPEVTVTEHNLKFIANLHEGQKTGLFLDQRENRQTVRTLAKDKTVLNLFSYNGGFSVYALAGGATHVTSVDIANAANRDAERNVKLNGFDESQHEALTADVFEMLESYHKTRKTFDIVVLDPPSLAKDKKNRYGAIRAYRKLNVQAMKCVKPGGLLVSSSCTSQVSPTDFKEILKEATQEANMGAQIIHEAGHALDHPVPLQFPEGLYLKFVVLKITRPVA